jgi:polyphosphate kinase
MATGFGNRELSWLAFDERVLEEAADPTTPLLERAKFAAIAAANLDEFFMVRVAGLQQEVADGRMAPDPSGLSPARQLEAISGRAHALSAAVYELTRTELLPALADAGIRIAAWDEIDQGPRAALSAFFANELVPRPHAVRDRHVAAISHAGVAESLCRSAAASCAGRR